jgi:hypothetical protein
LKIVLFVIACAAVCIAPARAESEADITRQLVALERQAMDGWMKGDPDPQLAVMDPKITYFPAVNS